VVITTLGYWSLTQSQSNPPNIQPTPTTTSTAQPTATALPTTTTTPSPTPTPKPTASPTPPSASPNPTPSPSPTPVPITYNQIGVPYIASDGLAVTLNALTITEKNGLYHYEVSYTLKNDTPDQKIFQITFKMYYKDASGGLPQLYSSGTLFPSGSLSRNYIFEESTSKPFDVLEYAPNNFSSSEPLFDSLKWQVVIQ
jgi:hypothetical protein